MGRKRKLINKVAFKKFYGKCYFCLLEDYDCLNVHRILPGKDDGIYSNANTLVVCSNCHAKIHSGQIVIDRKYMSTSKQGWVLHYWDNGKELWM